MSSVVGIDLGTAYSVVAVVKQGGIDIITNDVSNRRTPTVVGFTEKKREIGEAGKTQQARNVRNTIQGVKRLLGRKFKDPLLQTELQRLGGACQWLELSDGSPGVEVSLRYEKHQFTSQQLTAMFLAKLADMTTEALRNKVVDVVISIPGYFTDAQRRALLDASRIAGLHCFQVINDLSALAIAYGFYQLDIKDPIKVMFLDMGASALSVAIAEFTSSKCEILSTAYDAHLGGSDIDDLLGNFFAQRFQEKYKINIKENKRAWQRILDAVEKTKKSLNENDIVGINIECLHENYDLNDKITKQEYIGLLEKSGFFTRILEPIKAVLADTGLEAKQLEAIEWVGSALRAVPLQEAIAKFVGRTLSTTQNAEEAIAKGCALQCAILSPLFKVRDYKLIDQQLYPISLSWASLNDPSDTKETSVNLFQRKQQFVKSKYITFTRPNAKPFQMWAKYTNYNEIILPDISSGIIAEGRIPKIQKEGDAEVRVKVRLDNNGLVSLASAELVEKKEITVEVPVEEPKKEGEKKDAEKKGDGEPMETEPTTPTDPPATETKKDTQGDVEMKDTESDKPKTTTQTKIKTIYTKVDMETKYHSLPEDVIKSQSELEQKFKKEDDLVIAISNAKNALEAAVYSSKDKLSNTWSSFALQNEKDNIIHLCDQIESWLYDEGEDVSKEEYDTRLSALKKLTDVIHKRYYEWETVPGALNALRQLITQLRTEVTSGDEKYSHISKEDMEGVASSINDAEAYLNRIMPKYQGLTKTDNPAFFSSDLIQRRENLQRSAQSVLSRPKPEPPKEQKKEEPKKEEHKKEGEQSKEGQPQTPPPTTENKESMDTSS